MTIIVHAYHPRAEDLCGDIPHLLSESDSRPAAEQFDERYAHGGGWHPMQGWSLDIASGEIHYPGDPALLPVAAISLRDETVLIYPHAFVCILQADGSFAIARMD